MKSKALSLLLAVTAITTFSGCGDSNSEGDSTPMNSTNSEVYTEAPSPEPTPAADDILAKYIEKEFKTATGRFNISSTFESHDPSIFYDEPSGKYYIFGSHLAQGSSEDLINWTPLGKQGYGNSSVYGVLKEGLAGSFAWAGYDDSDCKNGYAVWAPEIIYNPHYVWEDGSKGAYMLYYSASSTYIRSCIGFAVSKNVEEGYQYVDTIIYSGFTNVEAHDKDSTHNKHVENTNVYEVYNTTKLEDINSTYFSGKEFNNRQFPNAIDATLFFDKDGRLWMSYGSWSGGLWILEMDPATGLPIHDEEINADKKNYTDPYFGKRIAYGNAVSGEGPYIRYDEATGYYWLFTSIGWLGEDGGYNIRLFRSENPDGPYLDAKGKAATDCGSNNASVGVKLLGGYDFPSLKNGYLSPGHNSFLMQDGKYYVVYHTRFENNGGIHKVRIHQMFLNEDNWLCAMPFQYANETLRAEGFKAAEIPGVYNIVLQQNTTNTTAIESIPFILAEDGTLINTSRPEQPVGTWSMQDGTNFITLDLANTAYKGVICEMTDEAGNPCVAISATADTNATLLAVMYK